LHGRLFRIAAISGKHLVLGYLPNFYIKIYTRLNSDVDVGAHGRARLHQVQGEPLKFGVAYRSPKSISSFMVGFKSAPTKRINEFRQTPGLKVWQPRFHDRIIRNEQEFQKKFKYIQKNPRNWTEG
jgi:hypothetical protein